MILHCFKNILKRKIYRSHKISYCFVAIVTRASQNITLYISKHNHFKSANKSLYPTKNLTQTLRIQQVKGQGKEKFNCHCLPKLRHHNLK